MLCIDPQVTCHKLDIDPKFRLFRQRQRRMVFYMREKMNKEVARLFDVIFVTLVEYM